ncbi:hypothetical protein GCM10022233_56840 [Streptomyces shaanxiensis]|uniref:Uncharacterized protein n=1 Tax=Streptomyces shaanxiensis TaxID=653357 RepID=A0ABP7VRU4_9ACTN
MPDEQRPGKGSQGPRPAASQAEKFAQPDAQIARKQKAAVFTPDSTCKGTDTDPAVRRRDGGWVDNYVPGIDIVSPAPGPRPPAAVRRP